MINKNWISELKTSLLTALWFVFLTFPLMVMKVTILGGVATTTWRFYNIPIIFGVTFFGSFVWRYMLERRNHTSKKDKQIDDKIEDSVSKLSPNFFIRQIQKFRLLKQSFVEFIQSKLKVLSQYKLLKYLILAIILGGFPFVAKLYSINVMISVLIFIILGLGLNIVVGYGGLLHLGYAAFYAVGAYSYGLFFNFMAPKFVEWGIDTGLMFWISIPGAALLSLIFGFIVCLPVIRLRGDYLAIVTLAVGQITYMFLQNEGWLTMGPSGISQIPRPWDLGMDLSARAGSPRYLYFVALALVLFSIKVVKNLEDSKIGRAWEAMREDDIACESMGIDLTKAKFASFSVGALWAGFAGVLLAAKTSFINPDSFTLQESITVLCIVVLGGIGSIPGIIIGAVLMIILPENFRFFSEYRMLFFGLALVLMMIFRPGGIIPRKRKHYILKDKETI